MNRRSVHFFAVFGVLATVATPAIAGERTALSAVPTLVAPKDAETPPKQYGVPGLSLKEQKTNRSSYYEITAATAQNYCLVNLEENLEMQPITTNTDQNEMWRLTEKDGTATLERTRYQVAPYLDTAWIKSKNTIALKPLATDLGVTAWAMRQANGDVVILSMHGTGGREAMRGSEKADQVGRFSFTHSECNFGAVRISAYAIAHGGGSAQLRGDLPAVGEGKARIVPQYVIDVSASKTSRDPEAVLSARIRKVDRGS